MKPATFTEIRARAANQSHPAVSIYLPNRPVGTLAFENRTRLRHLLRVAEIQLTAIGQSAEACAAILEPARALVDDAALWRDPPGGLVFFLVQGSAWIYELREAIGPAVFVGTRFHVKLLWPLLSDRLTYYLLALSQKSARLFRGNEEGLTEALQGTLPHQLADTLRSDVEPAAQIRLHGAGPHGIAGRRGDVRFFGAASNEEPLRDEQTRFCRQIDGALCAWLPSERPPLVLAGVRYLLDLYRQVSRYPALVEAEIDGNVDRADLAQLHAVAWGRLIPERGAAEVAARAEVDRLGHTARVTTDLRRVLPAASQGRIASLLVALDRVVWGRFDADTLAVHIDGDRRGSGLRDDLLDVAAGCATTTDARVFALPQRLMPDKNLCAAVLRFS